MTVICLHEHELISGADISAYEREVSETICSLDIPGLLEARLLKGFKGERGGKYAVLWIFESPEAIADNFGTLENPRWPEPWLHYENKVLAKYLDCEPDTICFTDYLEVAGKVFKSA
ncbi:hypothetical protein ACWJJH_16130 [Endozoicomonadaceae bacterium StTr2]